MTEGAAPDGTVPGATETEGRNQDGTNPDGTNPDGRNPDGTEPKGPEPPTDADSSDGTGPPTDDAARDPTSPDPLPSADPVLSDDPVAALGALLAERERCIRDLSVLCLDGVLQKGSAAMERDAAIIRSIQKGGEVPPEAAIAAGGLTLVERLGDSALVSLNAPGASPPGAAQRTPASTLVMRGEAGWRIRDYL